MASSSVMSLKYPIEGVTVEEIHSEAYEKFAEKVQSYNKFVRLMPYNQVVNCGFFSHAERIRTISVRDDDVWVSSFPKCGTTWTQEMVWCLVNNLDYEKAKEKTLDERVPYFELDPITDPSSGQSFASGSIDAVENMPSPRVIKTHLSWQMLPEQLKTNKNVKIIYVTRNPRDACVSFHNHWKVLEGYTGTLDEFVNAFVGGVSGYYSPFMHHVLEYWNVRHLPNVCFFTYEEMKKDLPAVIQKVASFLSLPIGDEDLPRLVEHLSFRKMKDNKAVNKLDFVKACQLSLELKDDNATFMRKGETGDWVNHFTPQQVKQFEEWEKKWLGGSDLKFEFTL